MDDRTATTPSSGTQGDVVPVRALPLQEVDSARAGDVRACRHRPHQAGSRPAAASPRSWRGGREMIDPMETRPTSTSAARTRLLELKRRLDDLQLEALRR